MIPEVNDYPAPLPSRHFARHHSTLRFNLRRMWTFLVLKLIGLFYEPPVAKSDPNYPAPRQYDIALTKLLPQQSQKELDYWQRVENEAYAWRKLVSDLQSEQAIMVDLISRTKGSVILTVNGNGGGGKTTFASYIAQRIAMTGMSSAAFYVANPSTAWNSIQSVGMDVDDSPPSWRESLNDSELAFGWGQMTGTGHDLAKLFYPEGWDAGPVDVTYTQVLSVARKNPYGLHCIGPWAKTINRLEPSGIMMRSTLPVLDMNFEHIVLDGGNYDIRTSPWALEMLERADRRGCLIFTGVAGELKTLQEMESSMDAVVEAGFGRLIDNATVGITSRSAHVHVDLEEIRRRHLPSFTGQMVALPYDVYIDSNKPANPPKTELQTQLAIDRAVNTALRNIAEAQVKRAGKGPSAAPPPPQSIEHRGDNAPPPPLFRAPHSA